MKKSNETFIIIDINDYWFFYRMDLYADDLLQAMTVLPDNILYRYKIDKPTWHIFHLLPL